MQVSESTKKKGRKKRIVFGQSDANGVVRQTFLFFRPVDQRELTRPVDQRELN
jgi:hypothetical protein